MKNRQKNREISFCRLGAVLLLCALLLSGCGTAGWEYRPITDVSDLEGRRVGVNLAWEADYYLTGREDMELYRYDTTADMILALGYDKVDALAMDGLMWKMMQNQSSGLEAVEPAFGETGYVLYFGPEREELAEDFNAFLAEYKQTEEYRDFLEREAAFDGIDYVGPEIPACTSGPILRIAVLGESFPRSFFDPGERVPVGFDMEAVRRYALARGCQVEYFNSTYDDLIIGLMNGLYDAAVGYLSDVYAEEVLAAGMYVSDSMDDTPMYFVQKTRQDISVELDELE